MNTDEIIQKSVSGAKWTVILSIVALPIGYVTNIILGRISPEALGIYGLLNIFILSVTTFILFGGGTVIIKYLPAIDKDEQVSFLASNLFIVFVIALFAIGLIYFYPHVLELIFGQEIPVDTLNYFIILIPIIILYSLFDYTLNGLMEIKTSVIIRKIPIFGFFIVFSILFILNKDFFREHLWTIIIGVFLFFYSILALLAFFLTIKKMRIRSSNKRNRFKFYLPQKFWGFALFVHLSTILVFAYDKVDQLFILRYFDIHELGLYYAALQTAMLIRFIPVLLGSVLLPSFSNLFASNEIGLIQKGYREVVRYNTLMVVPAALLCIFFSKQIMGLFGAEYVQNHLVLAVFGMFYAFIPMGGVNSSLVVAKGRTGIYLVNSIIQVGFQFILMLALISDYGILGLAIGRGAGVTLAQVGLILIVTKILNIGIEIPKSYKVGIITAVIASILYFYIPTQNIAVLTALFLGCLIFFLFFADYSKKDINFILKHLFARYRNKED
ncbi:Membrane protein involved in the export of O-antigen and teichoic acid [Candidatus Methanophagaceae archaeon]|nr:Membrane protein involved in the export of O-antigen and teichoic acid [Methanophagales archaeon]